MVSVKRSLKAKVSALEESLDDAQEKRTSSELEESSCFGDTEFSEKLKASEKKVEEVTTKAEALETEKEQLVQQLTASSVVEKELISETEELKRKLDTALLLSVATGIQSDQDVQLHEDEDNGSKSVETTDNDTQTDYNDDPTQVEYLKSAKEESQASMVSSSDDKAVQVDTVTQSFTLYEQESEEKAREVRNLKEEMLRNDAAHQQGLIVLKEAQTKIHQLLNIKEQLTEKNADLSMKIDELQPTDYQVKVSTALNSIQKIERSLCGQGEAPKESESEQLKIALAEIEEMKKTHLEAKQETAQRLTAAIAKVKEREGNYITEVNDLKIELEKAQKQLQKGSNAATTLGQNNEGPRVPESSTVSFIEVESVTSAQGTWGSSMEAIFRGKRVQVTCIAKEKLSPHSIHTIHKQVYTMAQIRHPNLVLFIAVSMDAPNGMMILTELLTCSLRQAYESALIKPDKLPTMLDVALALNFLHLQKKPIIHNHLSSLCVMVEEAGRDGKWRAKLSDVGTETSLMMLSESRGREPVYSAPELENDNDCFTNTPALDIYSYGVLLCELAVSSLPETAEALAELSATLKDTLPQISCLSRCCLAAKPEQRPAMGNMVKKIQNLVVNKIIMP